MDLTPFISIPPVGKMPALSRTPSRETKRRPAKAYCLLACMTRTSDPLRLATILRVVARNLIQG